MVTESLVYKDLLPLPDTDPTEHEGAKSTLLDAPTESHALALDSAKETPVGEQGAAQVAHAEEVVNLGWNEAKENVQSPLVGGLSNEDLWLLVRRFNKVKNMVFEYKELCLTFSSKCTMSRKSQQRLPVALI